MFLSSAAVAFSGGCDSAALLGVAREIFSKGVTAVTVDHRWAGMSCDHHVTNLTTAAVHLRLRPESSQEAEEAARLAQQLGKAAPQLCLRRSLTVPPISLLGLSLPGVPHQVIPLQWVELPSAGTQKRARRARYQALLHYCVQCGVDTLLLGHHQDDQIGGPASTSPALGQCSVSMVCVVCL